VKCPKCGYLGFEPADRCKNCGYDFALATPTRPLDDLPMRAPEGQDEQVMPDFALGVPDRASGLPLFGEADDDMPLITRPSPPRAPLAVRRATPEVPRLRTESRLSSLELPLGSNEPSTPVPSLSRPAPVRTTVGVTPAVTRAVAPPIEEQVPAHLAARLVAAVIDLAILVTIDLLIVYLTLKIAGITREEFALLPKIPLAIFLLAQNLGYLMVFTASGQTIGKMASGIKVVSAETEGAPSLAAAARRTLVWVALAVPAGLGFLSTLGADRRGLHDRLAATRVVRANV
jgi:uncharacterized RDD family membrane protein YckC